MNTEEKRVIKALVIATIGILLLVFAFISNSKAEDIYSMTRRIMMRNLYQSELAAGAKLTIIRNSEVWEQTDTHIKFSLIFEIENGKKKKRFLTELKVNLVTKGHTQSYVDLSKNYKILLDATP